nr:MAG TPA: hypothetical protein [Caudoviricetes sp.]
MRLRLLHFEIINSYVPADWSLNVPLFEASLLITQSYFFLAFALLFISPICCSKVSSKGFPAIQSSLNLKFL